MKKTLATPDALCYIMDAVNESGCLKEETMNRQPDNQLMTAAYERLSRDDELQGPSNSIKNQQAMLEDYASKYNLPNLVHYFDDGISGTRFDRPGFVKMMDDIGAGKIQIVLCKDTSRLGRDYLRVGLFLETLRQKGVRLIAIGDNVDTEQGEDEFMPFRNIIAEWHARDTSRKIKAVYKSKGMNGEHTTSHALYGYVKGTGNKNQWEIDPEAADIVRRIFRMAIDGHGPSQVAAILESENIHSPSYYMAQKGLGNNKNKEFKHPNRWHGTTVSFILARVEYMGHTVNFKTYKNNFKDKRRWETPAGQLVIFENTHEEIIDPGTWETANRVRQNAKRRRTDSLGEPHPLTGLLWCADCGGKLYNERGETRTGTPIDAYVCSTYRKHTSDCTMHRTRTDAIKDLVLDTLRTVSEYARDNEADFKRQVNEMFSRQQAGAVKAQRKKLMSNQKRRDELDRLIQRIYEDMVAGRLTDKRFEILSDEYEREQAELEQSIAELQTEVGSFDDSAARAESFLELTRRYQDFSELTAPMLHEFVRKIIVHERAEKHKRNTSQKVEIFLSFIEDYVPPIVSAEDEPDLGQMELERKREYEREYYRRRKENGGKPLTPEDTRTPEQIVGDDVAKREKWKAYNRDYQREYQRKLAREKHETKTAESETADEPARKKKA